MTSYMGIPRRAQKILRVLTASTLVFISLGISHPVLGGQVDKNNGTDLRCMVLWCAPQTAFVLQIDHNRGSLVTPSVVGSARQPYVPI